MCTLFYYFAFLWSFPRTVRVPASHHTVVRFRDLQTYLMSVLQASTTGIHSLHGHALQHPGELPTNPKHRLEQLPRRGTLRHFCWPALGLDANADETDGTLAAAREFGDAPLGMGAGSVACRACSEISRSRVELELEGP
jgi:hypothetical protein